MTQIAWWIVLAAGVGVGICVGMVGTSGVFMISVLTLAFGMTQVRAQGTSLFVAALPVWWVALTPYARAKNVDWRIGILMAIGLAAGSFFGSRWAQHVPDIVLKRIFGTVLLLVAIKMFASK